MIRLTKEDGFGQKPPMPCLEFLNKMVKKQIYTRTGGYKKLSIFIKRLNNHGLSVNEGCSFILDGTPDHREFGALL